MTRASNTPTFIVVVRPLDTDLFTWVDDKGVGDPLHLTSIRGSAYRFNRQRAEKVADYFRQKYPRGILGDPVRVERAT